MLFDIFFYSALNFSLSNFAGFFDFFVSVRSLYSLDLSANSCLHNNFHCFPPQSNRFRIDFPVFHIALSLSKMKSSASTSCEILSLLSVMIFWIFSFLCINPDPIHNFKACFLTHRLDFACQFADKTFFYQFRRQSFIRTTVVFPSDCVSYPSV